MVQIRPYLARGSVASVAACPGLPPCSPFECFYSLEAGFEVGAMFSVSPAGYFPLFAPGCFGRALIGQSSPPRSVVSGSVYPHFRFGLCEP